jgi:nitroreductase
MDIIEAMKTRKSVRDFKPDPVEKEVLREILDIAGRAPSSLNSQPWEFTVIAGKALNNMRKTIVEKLKAGEPAQPEHSVIGWPSDSIYRKRQVALAIGIFKLMGIGREDREKRGEWLERGFRFFDAPAAIIISVDRCLSEAGPLLDIGAAMQNICLAALVHGLGTCIEDQGVMYPEVVREFAHIPDSKRIIISIAIGTPNWDFPANKLMSARESVDSNTTWIGFE